MLLQKEDIIFATTMGEKLNGMYAFFSSFF